MNKKLISIVLPTFNEESNIEKLYLKLKKITSNIKTYNFEIIVIDNNSVDNTRGILRTLAKKDKKLKLIFNARNFGYIKSPYYGILNASGDAIILMCSDFQEPPELVTSFIKQWEVGYKIVLGIKDKADNSFFLKIIKSIFYKFLSKFTSTPPIPNATGFGLYDKSVINILRDLKDPYPFLRGIISQIGFPIAEVKFKYIPRNHGISTSNIKTLYDYMMLGVITHTKVPLRIIFLIGLFFSLISLLCSLAILFLKLLFWDSFEAGYAPLLILFLFLSAVQLLFLGILAEYIGFMITKNEKFPLVIESERINF